MARLLCNGIESTYPRKDKNAPKIKAGGNFVLTATSLFVDDCSLYVTFYDKNGSVLRGYSRGNIPIRIDYVSSTDNLKTKIEGGYIIHNIYPSSKGKVDEIVCTCPDANADVSYIGLQFSVTGGADYGEYFFYIERVSLTAPGTPQITQISNTKFLARWTPAKGTGGTGKVQYNLAWKTKNTGWRFFVRKEDEFFVPEYEGIIPAKKEPVEFKVLAYYSGDAQPSGVSSYTFTNIVKTVGYSNGNQWINCIVYRSNGTQWVPCEMLRSDGTKWIPTSTS